MDSPVALHRLHFAFTITYHYLFPQLTMGLALIIFYWKTRAWRMAASDPTGAAHLDQTARFWLKIFGLNFAMGVVTGIPMEFQFGTNWSKFSGAAGGVIGQTLAMEGMYSFFLESTFLGILIYGEQRVSRFVHWLASLGVFLGSWLSGFFIIATDAWMQHPVGYKIDEHGKISLESFSALMFNPWTFWQYLHNMIGAVVTASFVVASIGAYYLLAGKHEAYARTFLRTAVVTGFLACMLMAFPTGDGQGQMIAKHQPVTLAAMEGHFETGPAAPMAILGQPDVNAGRLDNPFTIPGVLSMMTYKRWSAEVRGLNSFPRDEWPDQIPLLFYSFHIMVGLGTIFMGVMTLAVILLWRGKLFTFRPMLWAHMLLLPFPYIANTAGWMTAELGRQPWLIYGLMRTADGASMQVSSGNTMFTLLGFMGIYLTLGVLFLFLVHREIELGPAHAAEGGH
ncbi:MAG: cytochrome ubiquinol oxidase subunit I [Acidobacteriota bacterium]